MRAKTINCLFDKIMWTLIYLFPIIAYIIICGQEAQGVTDFYDFMTNFFGSVGPIEGVLYSLFSEVGILPFTSSYGILYYAAYMVWVTIWHVIFDIIVFIPRLFHNLLAKLEKGDL